MLLYNFKKGDKRGNWTILEDRKFKQKSILCKCDCGNTKKVKINTLVQGKTKNCKKCQFNNTIEINKKLIGKKFNKLTVLDFKYIGQGKTRRTVFRCVCDCGNIRDNISKSELINNISKFCIECGKIEQGKSKFIDLTGKVFGDWTVISLVEKYGHYDSNREWLCNCKCGNQEKVIGKYLRQNRSLCCLKCLHKKLSDTRFNDISGKIFGKLTALERISKKEKPTPHGVTYWKCSCKCGRFINVSYKNLIKKKTFECKRCQKFRFVRKEYWRRLVQSAASRNLELSITKKYIWMLFVKQKGLCKLIKEKIILSKKSSRKTASLDRIDSSKGYIEGNVQWVHKDVNKMKQNFQENYLFEMCKKIVKHNV